MSASDSGAEVFLGTVLPLFFVVYFTSMSVYLYIQVIRQLRNWEGSGVGVIEVLPRYLKGLRKSSNLMMHSNAVCCYDLAVLL
jgi:hypothetical protein